MAGSARAIAPAIALLAAGAASGCAPAPAADAAAQRVVSAEAQRAAAATRPEDARAAWVRITPAGLAAMPAMAMSAAGPGAAAGGARRIPIGTIRRGDLVVCPRGDCALRLVLEGLEARPDGRGSAVVLEARARAATGAVPVRYDQTWPCAFSGRPECVVDVDTARAGSPVVAVQATLRLAQEGGSGLTRIDVAGAGVASGVDDADVSIAGANVCGAIWCSAANVVGASGILAGQANDALAAALREQAARIPSPIAARLILEPEDRAAEAALAFALADESHAGPDGIDLAARLSARPSRRHRCVPEAPAPPPAGLPRTVLDGGGAAGGNGAHARLVIGEAALARAAWALHQAGVMCVDADGADVPALTPAALGALLPASRHLAPLGVTAPSIAVRPLEPPRLRIAGDGSIGVELASVMVELWATVDRRPLRLARGTLEVRAVARVASGAGGLALEIPPDRIAVRVSETWSAPALGADEAELRSLFDALARVALSEVPARIALAGDAEPGSGVATPDPARAALSHLRLASPARSTRAGQARALVLDLRFEDTTP